MTSDPRSVVVVSAGLGQPSSTRLLADRLAAASERHLGDAGIRARIEVIELREHAQELINNLLTGFPAPKLQAAIDAVVGADALIAVSPIFNASFSGLFKLFFDVLQRDALAGTPTLLAATGGTARHSLALEHALRPLFAYLDAATVPTAVYAAAEDWGAPGVAADGTLVERIDRAARELATAVAVRPPHVAADTFADPVSVRAAPGEPGGSDPRLLTVTRAGDVRLPDVAGSPLAADRGREVERWRRRGHEDEEVAVLVGRPPETCARPHERRSAPRLPAEPLVEVVATGSEHPELVALSDQGADVPHDDRPETATLEIGRRGDRLHVSGPDRTAFHMDGPLDDGGMRDDPTSQLEDDVGPAERVRPILVAKPLILVITEGDLHQGAGLRELIARQLGGRAPARSSDVARLAGLGRHHVQPGTAGWSASVRSSAAAG